MPPTTYRDTILATPNLLVYHRLGEASGTAAVDEVAAPTGTYNGGPLLGQPGAIQQDSNKAAYFDGIDDVMSMSANPEFTQFASITVEWWQYVATGDSGGASFDIGGQTDDRCTVFAPWTDDIVYWDYGGTGAAEGRVTTSYVGHYDAWVNMSVSFDANPDSNSHEIWINGQQVAQNSDSTAIFANFTGGDVGRGLGVYFKGYIDEFAAYNRSLTEAERIEHYSVGAVQGYGNRLKRWS